MSRYIILIFVLAIHFNSFSQKTEQDTLKAANDFSGKDLKDNLVKLSDLKGKTVLLNFWFIKCPPCVKEMPQLNKLKKKYRSKEIEFISVTFEKKEDVKTFLKKNPFNFKIITDSWEIIQSYEGMEMGFPVNYVITPEGKIYKKFIGGVDVKIIEEAIKKVLGQ